jgi:hypothetical protein
MPACGLVELGGRLFLCRDNRDLVSLLARRFKDEKRKPAVTRN